MSFNRKEARISKKFSIRKKVSGTSEKPRMSIYRSLGNIYVQLIDDTKGETIVAASSKDKEIATEVAAAKGKISVSAMVGELIAKKAAEKNIVDAVFDRNGFRYHGRVKALADGARKGGMKI
ncbi:MAG: 50S ribosomal protein L18 [Ignavibacteriales bacterium]|nr:50S ribosomal protein L18 [Ignavibacteriales bacterium]MCF8315688.1 50S ribosomal protein L18 [Ignavibacteriales bacterium]MCF8437118.1 50S ribosomal protein L18 [Ignavibacteriales bacterium]